MTSNIHELRGDYDIIHYQNYYVPFLSKSSKKVVTIHDLASFKFSDTMQYLYAKYNKRTIKNSLSRADAIITPSITIKNEIHESFPYINENKIFQCNDGIRNVFWLNTNSKNILDKYSIEPFTYFFFIGSLSKRKNLKFLLETFIEAKKNYLIDIKTKLILAGQSWWGSSEIKDLISKNLGILTLGYLDDESIVELYRNCKALVFPSLYEGFGMPIIEAMSQNIPIIISNIPTSVELNEKHNNQMFIFNLGNKEQLIHQLSMLDKECDLIKSKLNYGSLSDYKFENIAYKHLNIYKTIL